MSDTKEKIVICVPGPWIDQLEVVRAVANSGNGNFLVAGAVFSDSVRKCAWHFGVEQTDPRIQQAFKVSSLQNPIAPKCLEQIDQHRSVVYLSSSEGGLEWAASAVDCARVLCRAGGYGVKFEVAGRAYSNRQWESLIAEHTISSSALYDLLVFQNVYDEPTDVYHSVGMPQFNLPDTGVEGAASLQDASDLIKEFNLYQLIEKPKLRSGQTFGLGEGALVWRIEFQSNHPYSNPYLDYSEGMWVLSPSN